MTPRELTRAAKNVLGIVNDPPGWIAKISDSKRLAKHILATVREDDDEPADEVWQAAVTHSATISGDQWIVAKAFDAWDDIPRETFEKTRGQFRALCKGLGIELKEKTNADNR